VKPPASDPDATIRRLILYTETELVASRVGGAVVALDNTMLACRRCSWEMKRRWFFWACENWRPWNFWRHDLTLRVPRHRSPCM